MIKTEPFTGIPIKRRKELRDTFKELGTTLSCMKELDRIDKEIEALQEERQFVMDILEPNKALHRTLRRAGLTQQQTNYFLKDKKKAEFLTNVIRPKD